MKRLLAMPLWAAAAVALLTAASPLLASGGGSAPIPDAPRLSPEQIAVNEYNAGLRYNEKARAIDHDLEAETDAKKRSKLESKRDSLFAKATKRLEAAIEAKPDFAQAHGSLGYALRRQGKHAEAMRAYDTALGINPNYPAAIEYRAEALLGLDRVPEALEAYERLAMISREHAAELLGAVKAWADSNSEAAAANDLGAWVEHREKVFATTKSGAAGSRSWR